MDLYEWRVSGEDTLLVYKNGNLQQEHGVETGKDFGTMEKPDVEEFLIGIYGDEEFRMVG